MEENILEIKNISKIYQTPDSELVAIKNISFNVKNKDFLAIVGPSGCGKSTILSIISGLTKKSNGKIKFFKKNPIIGYMFQNDTLFEWLTVYENCILGLKIQNKLNKENISYTNYLLKKYNLYNFINSYPSSLSGGMKQRIALIRTLAIKPDILLLDEPFSALDYQTRLLISQDIHNIIKSEEKTAIIITHDIEEAISLADKVIVLTDRPGTIKRQYYISHSNKNILDFRNTPLFREYFQKIWKDMNINVQ